MPCSLLLFFCFLWVFILHASQLPKKSPNQTKKPHLFQLILKTFTRLPVACQEKIILDVYKDKGSPPLSLVTDFDQSLTVTFNKLSAGASQQVHSYIFFLCFFFIKTIFQKKHVSRNMHGNTHCRSVLDLCEVLSCTH